MDFGKILQGLKDSLSGYNQDHPSVVGNLLSGNQWNQSIPDFGGVARENQMIGNPNIVSPIPVTDQLTPGLVNYYQNDAARAADTTPSTFQPKTIQYPDWMANAPASPPQAPTADVLGASAQSPSPTPLPANLADIAKVIQHGLTAYGSPPVTQSSDALATAGQGLPDPYLPAIISLIESGGGKNVTRGDNNIYNMNANQGGVVYPDINTAILGGDGHQGFKGIVNKMYQDYINSGNVGDFFNKYSPPSENAPLNTQVDRYNSIKKQYFTPQQ